ncbi:MAG: tRNA uridine-5-carboxymethylaminomethyl(34) synthesis GTPase MnmE [Bacillota bacterium]
MYSDDTIAAIATAVGESGIGIIRISGAEAIAIADNIFESIKNKKLNDVETYTAHYGHILDQESQVIDEVIALVMKEPKTYTTEDVVEINCHGGTVVLRKILDLVLDQGARLAEPGEFTKRAFLNGRIDLAQAEAVADLIQSKTEASMQVALDQLEGGLSEEVNAIKQDVVSLLAHLEATIDFPEDEIDDFDSEELAVRIDAVQQQLEDLLATSERGKILKEGIEAAIVGRPNVGKSSLLNSLVREKRAIVTDIPGTTRDIIEEVINIDGIPVKIIDTAGIRNAEDQIEKIGVEKSEEYLAKAELILLVVDISAGITAADEQLLKDAQGKEVVVIANKLDLDHQLELKKIKNILPEAPIVKTAAIANQGINELEDAISELVYSGQVNANEETMVSSLRHKKALQRAEQNIADVKEAFEKGLANDFLTIDLRAALEAINEITGDAIGEDIIDQIFADFCLGK